MKKILIFGGIVVIGFFIAITYLKNSSVQTVSILTDFIDSSQGVGEEGSYGIIDTSQTKCFNNSEEITCQKSGEAFNGQDADYSGKKASYTDNGNGTITDNNTGLMWQQDPGDKMSYDTAVENVKTFNLGGYTDWRIPTIKELYSLMDFNGTDPDTAAATTANLKPFLDNSVFKFTYGDTSKNERIIDSQYGSSNKYITVVNNRPYLFGVNFADGRIKGYDMQFFNGDKTFFFMYVRGTNIAKNNFVADGNDVVKDIATRLSWQKNDSGKGMNWEKALAFCEASNTGGYSDWRLPNVKELQSIVDYSRSPDVTQSAAIDPIFNSTKILNENSVDDYAYYWSGTTHIGDSGDVTRASYVAFGRGMGYMNNVWSDVHGAGSQKSDPKSGSASDYPTGKGPQGDAVRIDNYVRCVR